MLDKLLQRPNCLLNSRNRYQSLTTFIINLMAIAHGIGIGWFAPTMRKLQTSESPVDFPVTVSEISWIGSALGIGATTGNIIVGTFIHRVGNKWCLLFIAIPHTCLWILVHFGNSVECLIVGRFLSGISSGGMYIVHSMFISEISDARIRGTLGAMVMLFVNIGILLGYIAGTHIPYSIIPFIVVVCPIVYFACTLFFVPESPMYLIRKGRFSAAEKSFRYYKNIKESEKSHAMVEFEQMKQTLTEESKGLDRITLADFYSPLALKSYVPAAVLLIVNQFSGLFAMVSYMSDIFDMSGSTMDPDTCTIVIGIVQILGTYATTLLCDVCGRKILLIASSAGVSVGLTCFGFFTYFSQKYDLSEWSWVPLVSMSTTIFLGNIGLIGCFFTVLVEIFPLKIRTRAASIAVVICGSMVFVALNVLPICLTKLGVPATMWACAGITAFGFVYFAFFLKETKGKSMLDD